MMRIMVGVDGSEAGWGALRFAAESWVDQRIDVVHVVTPMEPDAELARVEARLDREEFGARCLLRCVRSTDVARALATASGSHDLLVVGTDKTGYIRGHVFGSTSIRVATVATSPLLVVPVQTAPRVGVVVAVEPDRGSAAVIEFAAREAARVDEPLTMLVDEPETFPEGSTTGVLAAALAVASEFCDASALRARPVRRRFVPTVLHAALGSRMLVVPNYRDGGAAALSPIAHDVLMNIGCPTYIVPTSTTPVPVEETPPSAGARGMRRGGEG